ncbi:MAG: FtsX-like permease family protein [Flavobacteriales bacterium]|nr:FtsX-like permease family protein [Flavobacteriales bacterium]
MNLLKIAFRNIFSKPLNTILSLVLLGFGVGIISLMLNVEQNLQEQFDRDIKDIDMVLGAKGSPLQLILANVYHVDAPTGNISRKEAERIAKHPYIEEGIPLAYGDNYRSYRIVGTTPQLHEHYGVAIAEGELFSATYSATIGSAVAEATGLKIGDNFFSAHGLTDETDVHTNHAFTVVGIFEPSGSVIDKLLLTPMESIWGVHEYVEEETGEKPDEEITAMLLKKKNPMAIMALPRMLEDTNMQIALPSIEINRLQTNFGIGMGTIQAIAYVVIFLSILSIFISLFNSLRERKYELALMRTMGASQGKLFSLIILEGLSLTFMGMVFGLLLSRVGLWILASVLKSSFQYDFGNLWLVPSEWLLVVMTIFVGIVASLLPAFTAVKIDISKTLADG